MNSSFAWLKDVPNTILYCAFGYIRNAQNLLPETYYEIPSLITYIVIYYLHQYQHVQPLPAEMPRCEMRYGSVIHSGFLMKRSRGNTWSSRYAVLYQDCRLRFYETEERGNVLGKIKMEKIANVTKIIHFVAIKLNPDNPYFFAIKCELLKKIWHFGCEEYELQQWIDVLRAAIELGKSIEVTGEKE
eukprot:488425_1